MTPGQGLNLGTPSGANGRSYITYSFKDSTGNVVYVGRASGKGNKGFQKDMTTLMIP